MTLSASSKPENIFIRITSMPSSITIRLIWGAYLVQGYAGEPVKFILPPIVSVPSPEISHFSECASIVPLAITSSSALTCTGQMTINKHRSSNEKKTFLIFKVILSSFHSYSGLHLYFTNEFYICQPLYFTIVDQRPPPGIGRRSLNHSLWKIGLRFSKVQT